MLLSESLLFIVPTVLFQHYVYTAPTAENDVNQKILIVHNIQMNLGITIKV